MTHAIRFSVKDLFAVYFITPGNISSIATASYYDASAVSTLLSNVPITVNVWKWEDYNTDILPEISQTLTVKLPVHESISSTPLPSTLTPAMTVCTASNGYILVSHRYNMYKIRNYTFVIRNYTRIRS